MFEYRTQRLVMDNPQYYQPLSHALQPSYSQPAPKPTVSNRAGREEEEEEEDEPEDYDEEGAVQQLEP